MTGNRELLKKFCDRPIAFHRPFVPIGGICGALMLSQAVYWSTRTKDPDGWFYKTQREWQEETGMTRSEQETARRKLKGILLSKRKGTPAKLYFRVDYDALIERLQLSETPRASLQDCCKQDCAESANLYTETTAETTAENTGTNVPGTIVPSVDGSKVKTETDKHRGERPRESPRATWWRLGVEILTSQEMTESNARAFLGKQAKLGEKKLARLIGECAVKTPANARAYIASAMSGAYNLYVNDQLIAAGKAYDVLPKVGESMEAYRLRVQESIKEGRSIG